MANKPKFAILPNHRRLKYLKLTMQAEETRWFILIRKEQNQEKIYRCTMFFCMLLHSLSLVYTLFFQVNF